ncbi:MAG: glycosyltransferase family 39 protein [Chloroflexi bacterium]|nr:glycosyltransferase family 39 protein [Chloroflexota bacterium]
MKADAKTPGNRLKLLLKPDFIGWLLVILGIVLRLRQYIANRSFWHDEANLALNLVNRTFGGLTQPLDYDQGAPIGFLFIEKLFMTVMGNKDYILRLFPLFSGLLATYLIYRIAREYFVAGGLFAILMFVISWPLIYYSSELKQYSSDAMFALLLMYLSFKCIDEKARPKDFFMLGTAGFVSIWISHPSAFILAGIGLVLVSEKLIRKAYTPLLWTLGLGVAWTISFGATYLVSLRYLISDQSLQSYWSHGFMPLPIWHHLDWLAQTYLMLLETVSPNLYLWYLTLSCSILIVIGLTSLLLRDRNILFIIVLPFLTTLAASALQKYPLKERFMLFLVPSVILLIAEGIGRIHTLIGKWNRSLAFSVCFIAALTIFWSPANAIYGNFLTPPMGDDIKPVMIYVEQHRIPNDVIYVYHGARPSFNYYAPFYGFDTGKVISGLDLANAPALKQFYSQVDQLKGNARVWVIFSHIVACGGCTGDMETFYVQYLNQFGKVEDQFKASGADVYFYNLNR